MPSLIRLIILLLFLAGLAYGAMFALVALVQPGQKEITVRVPTRDLLGDPGRVPVGGEEEDAPEPEGPVAETPVAETPEDQPE